VAIPVFSAGNFFIVCFTVLSVFAQSYNEEQTVFANCLKRMYNQPRFVPLCFFENIVCGVFVFVFFFADNRKRSSRFFRIDFDLPKRG
jgi:hypothetical protein